MSNANYTRIQAHGTAGTFEPGFINRAATVGPQHGPVSGSYKFIDIDVDIVDGTLGKLYQLGDAIPQGCIITTVSMNGGGTLEAGVGVDFGVATDPSLPSSDPNNSFTSVQAATAATAAAVPGGDLNGGEVFAPSIPFPEPAPGQSLFPVLALTTAITNPNSVITVKVVYFCP